MSRPDINSTLIMIKRKIFLSLSKKTLLDYFIVLLGSGCSRIAAFLNTIIIARMLGVSNFGKFSIFYSVFFMSWQIPLAFDSTYVRYAKTCYSKEGKNDFLKSTILLKLIYAFLFLIFSKIIAHFLATVVFKKDSVEGLVLFGMIGGIFLTFLRTIGTVFQEKEKFFLFSIIHGFYTYAIFIVLVYGYIFNFSFSLQRIVELFLAISVTLGSLSIVVLLKKTNGLLPIHNKYVSKLFALGKWIFGVIFLQLLFERLATFFLSRYGNFHELGLYSAAVQITMVISLLRGALTGVFLPKASKCLTSKKSFWEYVREAIVVIFIITLIILILGLLSPIVIHLLYGKKYLGAILILKILLIGLFFYILYLPFSYLFYVIDDSKTRFSLELIKVLIGCSLLYMMVPYYGVIGTAIAITVSLTSSSVISLYIVIKKTLAKLNTYKKESIE